MATGIAAAHELNQSGESISVPSYDESMKLVTDVQASAQSKALGERLQKIRVEARTDNADTQHLRELYESIPEELTHFNHGGTMTGSFNRLLIRGLTEAKEQNLYSGAIPDLELTSQLYTELDKKNGRILQLFTPTFNHGDIEEMTGLYLEALSFLESASFFDPDIPEEAVALQWLAHSKWLASHDSSITSLKSLQEARDQIKKAPKNAITRAMKKIRDLKWPDRRAEDIPEAAKHYRKVVDLVKKRNTPVPSNRQRPKQRYHQVPFYSVPSGYVLYDVPHDGLCMYHALSRMYGIPLQILLITMVDSLHTVTQIIAFNLAHNAPCFNGLSPSAQLMVMPFMHISESNSQYNLLQELEYAISALEQAIHHTNYGGGVPSSAWGMHSLLNTAIAAIYQYTPSTATPFVAQLPTLNADGTAYTGAPQFTQYDVSGSTYNQLSPNGLPLLIHAGGNHWMYALPAVDESVAHSLQIDQLNDMTSGVSFNHGNPANLPFIFQNLHLQSRFNFAEQRPPKEGIFKFSAH